MIRINKCTKIVYLLWILAQIKRITLWETPGQDWIVATNRVGLMLWRKKCSEVVVVVVVVVTKPC